MTAGAYLLRFCVGVVPVFAFLGALAFIDSYKLVSFRRILRAVVWGCGAAGFCYLVNSAVVAGAGWDTFWYSRLGAPILEEVAKAIWIIWLIRTAQTGFMVDAAICGVATGAGFALVENATDLHLLGGSTLALWTLRGFGTAMMHGGTTAIVGVSAIYARASGRLNGIAAFVPGLLLAIAIHSAWNAAVLTPLEASITILLGLPVLFSVLFIVSEKSLRKWMGDKLDKDVELLRMISTGGFLDTNAGRYLRTLHRSLSPYIVGDMLCLLQVSLELSVRAKGDLMRREAGFPVEHDASVAAQLCELDFLTKSIGIAGRRALSPLLPFSQRDLWEMHRLSDPD